MSSLKTRSQEIAADVAALLRARNSLLWIVTREEARTERYILEAAAAASYVPRTWDVSQGFCEMDGSKASIEGVFPADALTAIAERTKGNERGLFILRDLPIWIAGPGGARELRQLRNLARLLPTLDREKSQALVVLTPSTDVPPELANHVTVIEWPLPDRAEIASILDAAVESLPETDRAGNLIRALACPADVREVAIDAAVGLSGEEAASCYAKSLVSSRKIDPATVSKEKKRIIARERVLEWIDPIPGGLEAVGGLDALKAWLKSRTVAYSPEAKAYGLPAPRGCLLVGVPGCGKSLLAKAIATARAVPLLRVDLGALKSKFVGESEATLRKALRVIEAIGPCVVWFDEIEKALQGATSGSADGGVSSDALGTILTWMQERQGDAFIVATCNDVSALPPELLRAGRFDVVWFVDLPNEQERVAVLAATLRTFGRSAADIDFEAVAAKCDGFSGAEIAALVPEALYTAFDDKARQIKTADLIGAAASVVPLIKTAPEKIAKIRDWAASGKARPATAKVERGTAKKVRALDL